MASSDFDAPMPAAARTEAAGEAQAPTDEAPSFLDAEALDFDTLVEILVAAEDIDAAIVGGQALNIWAEYLYDRAPVELDAFAPYTSKDIDYFGRREAAEAFRARIGGEIAIPTLGRETPNSAVVAIQRDGRMILVDFLDMLAGIDDRDLRFQKIEIPLDDRELTIRLLHPFLVLRSRIAGVITLRRRDDTAIRQLKAAPVVLREYIRLVRDEGEPETTKDAQRTVGGLARLAGTPEADRVFLEHDVDLIATMEELGADDAWDHRFRRCQILERAATILTHSAL